MRKNWFTTLGGIISALAGIPFAVGTYAHQFNVPINIPGWLYIICIAGGVIGPVVIGFGAKGQDQKD